jgi:hypothetical protein
MLDLRGSSATGSSTHQQKPLALALANGHGHHMAATAHPNGRRVEPTKRHPRHDPDVA